MRRKLNSNLNHVPCGVDSSAHLQAHSHLDHHQGDEESIYKLFHHGKLQFKHQLSCILPTPEREKLKNTRNINLRLSKSEYNFSPLGCHIS